jgi:ribosomal protein L37E
MNEIYPDEQAMVDKLYSLIRYLYRKKLAAEIIAAFEETLTAKQEREERLAIVQHWLDFYQAYKYRKMMRRRRATDQERMTPCSACGYPASHRHHLWDIATHGENQVTVQLCANCHELHHLMYNTLARGSDYSRKLVLHILFSGLLRREVIQKIYGWCRAILQYEIDNGWLENYKLTDLWIEDKLRWTDYLNTAELSAGTKP